MICERTANSLYANVVLAAKNAQYWETQVQVLPFAHERLSETLLDTLRRNVCFGVIKRVKRNQMNQNKRIKVFAVCFKLNKKCLQGEIHSFPKRRDAKSYIKELHKKIGGFEEDHHIVPCTILLSPKKKSISSKKKK